MLSNTLLNVIERLVKSTKAFLFSHGLNQSKILQHECENSENRFCKLCTNSVLLHLFNAAPPSETREEAALLHMSSRVLCLKMK